MTAKFNSEDLPYDLISKNARLQVELLADILKIPQALVANGGELELQAMTGTILYRHLDTTGRRQAMEVIRSLPNKALQSRLVTLVLDTTFINPQWGMWSLTNKELLRDKRSHELLDKFATYAGVSISGLGLKDAIAKIWKTKKVGPGLAAIVAIWGVVGINSQELNQTNRELERRAKSELRSSQFY